MTIKINTDDYGISKNVSDCINVLSKKNLIHSTSIFVNTDYFEKIKNDIKYLNIEKGLHFSITEGKCLSKIKQFSDNNYYFKYSGRDLFKKYFLKNIDNNLLEKIFDEFKYQFNLLSNYIKIEHVSSHEHVHMIPPLFEKIEKFCNSNDVKYLRNFNENLSFNSISEFINFFYDSNYLKFSVLKICQFKLKNKSYIYTYGLKNSGKIAFDGLSRLIKRYKNSKSEIEIYLHPAFKYECETDYNLKDYDLNFIKSYERVKEYEFINSLSINQLNEYN